MTRQLFASEKKISSHILPQVCRKTPDDMCQIFHLIPHHVQRGVRKTVARLGETTQRAQAFLVGQHPDIMY